MKKLLGIVVLGLLWCNVANAFCFLNCKTPGLYFSIFDEDEKPLSGSDPSSYGCVYDEFGDKVKCVSFNFNEIKQKGSYAKAQSKCKNYLKKYLREGYTWEGCI